MGITKTELFEQRQNQLAALAKAIGHPARVAILEYLLEHQTCISTELADELPLSPSTINQHLKELKQAGLIKGEIEGPKVNYCIDADAWGEARQLLERLFGKYTPPPSCC
ncbi:DNA-binding transcriptional regulator, ArsR family [Catalinimonas alkaloidigena]|uniref:DNA-binding transcriptional regulator, ArsR family n=1 Tax=Catalinimonas alkaloidigena TaxID=1075417 RepID=A0A1G9TID6_9BACT|nr:metalloregulator ArsR/SmtB family transcription factor [Catalinimonas alkaloidigena]SDM47420.1 DNA-binding transcriptional regulator, ArsR family [Catalinimonas alkaloidigena]